MTDQIEFVDLQQQRRRLGTGVEDAIRRVLDHGRYIMGPEVAELETALAAFTGARHAISCSSGTDALLLAAMAWSVGPGDAVVVPAFTFPATPECVALLGATPVFADVNPDTFNIDPGSAREAIAEARAAGLRPVGIIPVDLFGQPADYIDLRALAAEYDLWVLADGAQSLGATLAGAGVGTLGDITATSFFPAKPLGCYGDGGAVFTDDDDLAAAMRSIRVHGAGTEKYDIVRIGINGRIDTIQAAVLLEKLRIFPSELEAREVVAGRYGSALQDVVAVPELAPDRTSAWAQYTIKLEDRDRLASRLAEKGVPSAIYYPRPLHMQSAYQGSPRAASLANAEHLAQQVLSLPMHPYLDEPTQTRVVDAVRSAL